MRKSRNVRESMKGTAVAVALLCATCLVVVVLLNHLCVPSVKWSTVDHGNNSQLKCSE